MPVVELVKRRSQCGTGSEARRKMRAAATWQCGGGAAGCSTLRAILSPDSCICWHPSAQLDTRKLACSYRARSPALWSRALRSPPTPWREQAVVALSSSDRPVRPAAGPLAAACRSPPLARRSTSLLLLHHHRHAPHPARPGLRLLRARRRGAISGRGGLPNECRRSRSCGRLLESEAAGGSQPGGPAPRRRRR